LRKATPTQKGLILKRIRTIKKEEKEELRKIKVKKLESDLGN
jgi:hypothetical protein